MSHFIFTKEHEAVRKTIRRFVEKELAPHAGDWEEAEYFADWVFPRMGELGLLGLHYPVEYGGQVSAHKFAGLAAEIEAARQLVYYTAWKFANGQYPVKEISMSKLVSARVVCQVADEALQIHGRLHDGVPGPAGLAGHQIEPHRRRHR